MIKLLNILKEVIKEEEKAYHASPHRFRCFRAAGIGGGVGAQAYGWGLYFGKDFDIANSYASSFSSSAKAQNKKQILFQGKSPEELALEYDNGVFARLPQGLKTAEEFIEYATEMVEILQDDEFEGKEEVVNDYKRFIETIKDLQVETENMSYFYEVILHKGKSPDQYTYLNWDERTTPQNQIDKINNQAKKENLNFQFDTSQSPANIYLKIENYFAAKGSKWGAKDASLFLLRAGIDGNTHANGNVRIIFDEKAIEIINVCSR